MAGEEEVVVRGEWPRPSFTYLVGLGGIFVALWGVVATLSLALGRGGEVSLLLLVILYAYIVRFSVTYELGLGEFRCRSGFGSRVISLQRGTTMTYTPRATLGQMLSLGQTIRRYDDLIELRRDDGRSVVISPSKEFARDLETAAKSRGVVVERRAR